MGYREEAEVIAVDLGGDGIDLAANEVGFDLVGDGGSQDITLVGSDDAMLVFDFNQNGTIDDGFELGVYNSIEGIVGMMDDNGDGLLDTNDDLFDMIYLWQDVNENGVSEGAEMMTLADLGILTVSSDGNGGLALTYTEAAQQSNFNMQEVNLGYFAI